MYVHRYHCMLCTHLIDFIDLLLVLLKATSISQLIHMYMYV